jgi:DNA-binding MarR family transcriptional regulator
MLLHEIEGVLRPFDLTLPQYSILRALERKGEEGATCGALVAEILARAPDITRLLDRLERRGLLTRTRSSDDARVVLSRLTPQGRRLLVTSEPVVAAGRRSVLRGTAVETLDKVLEAMEAIEAGHRERAPHHRRHAGSAGGRADRNQRERP